MRKILIAWLGFLALAIVLIIIVQKDREAKLTPQEEVVAREFDQIERGDFIKTDDGIFFS